MARSGWLLVVVAALCGACAHHFEPPESGVPGLAGATKVYTLTNLHPDGTKMYSANFQQPGLIPVCTEVTLLRVYDDWMTFKVNATGTEYAYVEHPASAPEPFGENLARYFGSACPRAELDSLTPLEQEAVKQGVAKKGMRQRAVTLAIGYPSMRDTRTLELPYWRYWTSRVRFFMVTFDDKGVVEDVAY
jgi:hypothetical protein